MLKSPAAWALSYRLLVVALSLVTAGLGAWAFVNLPVDAYPNIAQTQVKIILKAPGMTPEEVESRVITPIEMEMLGIPGQAILRSSAKYAIADILIPICCIGPALCRNPSPTRPNSNAAFSSNGHSFQARRAVRKLCMFRSRELLSSIP